MNTSVHFSSESNEWDTPQDFFDKLNKEFKFNLDPCATKENAKCKKFYTEEDDGLSKNWNGKRVFCNPPYGKVIPQWVKKASEAQGGGSSTFNSLTNRHSIFSRVYLQETKCRNTFSQGSSQIWWMREFSTISKYGSNF